MRRSYLHALRQLSVSRKTPGFLLELAKRYTQVQLDARLDTHLATPVMAVAILNRACPYRCNFCDLPQQAIERGSDNNLSLEEWRRIINELADFGVFAMMFSGGEVSMEKHLAELIAEANNSGMLSHLSTTGLGLDDPGEAEKLVRAGLNAVTMSALEFHGEELRPFPRMLEAAAAFRQAASKESRPISVATTTVIRPGFIPDTLQIIEKLLASGMDRVGVMPEHDVRDSELRSLFIGRERELQELSEGLIRLKKRTGRIDNSWTYLRALPRIATDSPLPVQCVAPETSLVIDEKGALYSCTPDWLMDRPSGSVREQKVADAWYQSKAVARRDALRGCRACLWNCHAETSMGLLSPLQNLRQA